MSISLQAQEACKVRNTSRHSQLCFLFFKLQDEGDSMFKILETVALPLISFGPSGERNFQRGNSDFLTDFQRGALDSIHLLNCLQAPWVGVYHPSPGNENSPHSWTTVLTQFIPNMFFFSLEK